METITIISLVVIAIIILYIIIVFNSLISLDNAVKTAWSGIDVQLKRRSDLIPNLISTVKAYAKHEKEVFEKITKARVEMITASDNLDLNEMGKNDRLIRSSLKSIFAIAESYPNLKANENFLRLQSDLTETEDQISASRRIYNENVNYFNVKVLSFPSNIISKIFNFKKKNYFEASNLEKQEIKTQF